MPLTDIKVKNAKPTDKPYKLTDGDGMFLLVHSNGGKYWRMKYRYAGKEKVLALGVYPETSLNDARHKRFDARKLLAGGTDPGEIKKESKRQIFAKSENTFELLAREWHKSRLGGWSENYAGKVMTSMEQDVFPKIGNRPIADINAPELLEMLRKVESRGALETAHRVKQTCGQVFLYAIACGRAERNLI